MKLFGWFFNDDEEPEADLGKERFKVSFLRAEPSFSREEVDRFVDALERQGYVVVKGS